MRETSCPNTKPLKYLQRAQTVGWNKITEISESCNHYWELIVLRQHPNYAGWIWKRSFISIVRPTVHTKPQRNLCLSPSNRMSLKTPDLRFRVEWKQIENGAFLSSLFIALFQEFSRKGDYTPHRNIKLHESSKVNVRSDQRSLKLSSWSLTGV